MQLCLAPLKVLAPLMLSRVKELDDDSRVRIDTSDVWALVDVAVITRPSKIIWFRKTSMFFGDDVICLEGKLIISFGNQTVFTYFVGALSH